jgi:transcriptional regulator with XRE-family HTH domain
MPLNLQPRCKADAADRHIGARIREQRQARGISQEALAAALGLTFQQVGKYERGRDRVAAARLARIAAALDAPIISFFEGLPRPAAGQPA